MPDRVTLSQTRRRVARPGLPRASHTTAWRAFAVAALVLTTFVACSEKIVTRSGPPQQRIVSRVYPRPMSELRGLILERYTSRAPLPHPFRVLTLTEQPPPGYNSDWLVNLTDPGGFLEPYRRLPAAERSNDLVLQDGTLDQYWLSEYQTEDDAPVLFRCGLVIHFVERAPTQTELQVFEIVPTVFAGRHWAMAKEGIGFGRYSDVRFVEPTVKDREAVLDLVDALLK